MCANNPDRLSLPCSIPSEASECIEFSQVCMERDFHKVVSLVGDLHRKINRYIKMNAQVLPECVELSESGEYSAEDLREIILGCYEDFNYIFNALDKAHDACKKTEADFYDSMLDF